MTYDRWGYGRQSASVFLPIFKVEHLGARHIYMLQAPVHLARPVAGSNTDFPKGTAACGEQHCPGKSLTELLGSLKLALNTQTKNSSWQNQPPLHRNFLASICLALICKVSIGINLFPK